MSQEYEILRIEELPFEKIRIVPSIYADETPAIILSFEMYERLMKFFKQRDEEKGQV